MVAVRYTAFYINITDISHQRAVNNLSINRENMSRYRVNAQDLTYMIVKVVCAARES